MVGGNAVDSFDNGKRDLFVDVGLLQSYCSPGY